MKNLAFALMSIIAFPSMTQGQIESSSTPVVRTREADQELGTWITHGKLINQAVNLSTGGLGWYVYQTRSGSWIFLSGRLAGINDLLREEVSKDSAKTFLTEHLAALLVDTMAPDPSSIINNKFIEDFITSVPSTAKKLQHYRSDPRVQLMADGWAIEFNVASNLGGIEHWRVTGRLSPLCIKSFSREIAEPNGSFAPIMVTGNTK